MASYKQLDEMRDRRTELYKSMLRDASTLPAPDEPKRWTAFLKLERQMLRIGIADKKWMRHMGKLPVRV